MISSFNVLVVHVPVVQINDLKQAVQLLKFWITYEDLASDAGNSGT